MERPCHQMKRGDSWPCRYITSSWEDGTACLNTHRLLLAEDLALLVGLLLVSLHHVLQALLVGQVLLYLIVQYLWRYEMFIPRGRCSYPGVGEGAGGGEATEAQSLQTPRWKAKPEHSLFTKMACGRARGCLPRAYCRVSSSKDQYMCKKVREWREGGGGRGSEYGSAPRPVRAKNLASESITLPGGAFLSQYTRSFRNMPCS